MSYYSSLHPSCSHKSLLLCLGPSQFFSILRQYWIHLSLFTKTYYRLLLQESSSSCPCFCLITWYLFYTTFEWSKCFSSTLTCELSKVRGHLQFLYCLFSFIFIFYLFLKFYTSMHNMLNISHYTSLPSLSVVSPSSLLCPSRHFISPLMLHILILLCSIFRFSDFDCSLHHWVSFSRYKIQDLLDSCFWKRTCSVNEDGLELMT